MQYCLDGLIEKLGEMENILTRAQRPGQEHILTLWGIDEITALGEAKERLEQITQWQSKKIAELERLLAETEQYLAVAEGQADGRPPGWVKKGLNQNHNWWVCEISPEACLYVDRWKPSGIWVWKVDFNSRPLMLTGTEDTAREAMSAAEAAYQEAIRCGSERVSFISSLKHI